MTASEFHAAVLRLAQAGLIEQESRKVRGKPVEEFLSHGVPYAFPARQGPPTRGVPTSHMAAPLNALVAASSGTLGPVWPDAGGKPVTLGELYQLEEKLRAAGFRNDTKEGAPICRWVVSGVTVDVMPTEGSVCVHAMRRSRGGRGQRRSCRARGPRSVRRGLR